MEEEGLEEMINLILQESEYVDKTITGKYIDLVRDIKDRLLRGGETSRKFKNRTGNLRRSMEVIYSEVNNNPGIEVMMLMYGYFISLGVNGRKTRMGIPLTEEVQTAFGTYPYTQNGYRFGDASNPIKVPGIKPFDFYDRDILNKIVEILNREE